MATYRKKPVVIDAEQWYPGKEVEGCTYPAPDKPASLIGEYGFCATAEGGLYVTPGDWILKGNSKDLGVHYWVNKPDYFNENYEAVNQLRVGMQTTWNPLEEHLNIAMVN